MAEKLNNFEKCESDFSLFSTQTPPNDWPDALDRLTIDLVANKYTKFGKTSENLMVEPVIQLIL